MPQRKGDDWSDLPAGAARLMGPKKWFWKGMMNLDRQNSGSYRDFIRAYAACCSFADMSVGRLISALDESGHAVGLGHLSGILGQCGSDTKRLEHPAVYAYCTADGVGDGA